MIGAGAVNVWVRSSAPNVDLQATISEVRPDGKETFVQNGWVRGNERKLDAAKSTPLEPVLSLRESDVSPLPADEFVEVTIPLYYEGHAYRAGSRIRVTIAAPNGTQPIWAFDRDAAGTARRRSRSPTATSMPSHLLLPVVPGRGASPTELPPCPGLRGAAVPRLPGVREPAGNALSGERRAMRRANHLRGIAAPTAIALALRPARPRGKKAKPAMPRSRPSRAPTSSISAGNWSPRFTSRKTAGGHLGACKKASAPGGITRHRAASRRPPPATADDSRAWVAVAVEVR